MLDEKNIEAVKRDGISIVPKFFSANICDTIIRDINGVIREHRDVVEIDKVDSDHRIYGIEHASSEIYEKFFTNLEIAALLQRLYKVNQIDGTILGQYVSGSERSHGSGVSWHRDSFPAQYKAFVFLTDITKDSGSFEYYPTTHLLSSKALSIFRLGYKSVSNLDFSDDELRKKAVASNMKPRQLLCDRGTLVLVDTSMIHRGCPSAKVSRYSLTFYAFAKAVPVHIRKLSEKTRALVGG